MSDLKQASGTPQSTRSSTQSSSGRHSAESGGGLRCRGGSIVRADDLGADPPMLEAKTNRKRAEGDLQMLANRIALLRTEEQKALGKINETQARAKEILNNKRRNESHLQERFSVALQKEMAVKVAQDRAAAERELLKNKVMNSKKFVEESKRNFAAEKKMESRKFDEMHHNIKMQAENEKRKKADDEKKRKEALRLQREKEREDRERSILNEYESRIEMEHRKKAEAEDTIDRMEREERDLIDRLKKTQELQQQAYSTLQQSFES